MFQKAAPPLPHQMSAGPEFACDFRVALPCRTLQHHPRSSCEELTGLVSAKPSFQDGSVTRGDLERLGSRHNRLTERVFTKLQPPPLNGNELLTRDTSRRSKRTATSTSARAVDPSLRAIGRRTGEVRAARRSG